MQTFIQKQKNSGKQKSLKPTLYPLTFFAAPFFPLLVPSTGVIVAGVSAVVVAAGVASGLVVTGEALAFGLLGAAAFAALVLGVTFFGVGTAAPDAADVFPTVDFNFASRMISLSGSRPSGSLQKVKSSRVSSLFLRFSETSRMERTFLPLGV